MQRESRKRTGIVWLAAGIAIVGILMISAAGGNGGPAGYSGVYTDKQGTDEVYSELELSRNVDGTYAVTLGIHRV